MYPVPEPPVCPQRLYIEAVTVCVDYSDFLSETLPFTLSIVDRLIVGTTKKDERTRDLCRKYGVQTILTDEHRRQGTFNKGRLVERCLQHLSANGWRLHIDADMAMPHRTRHLLESAHLDECGIYGCDRVMVRSRKSWERLKSSAYMQHSYSSIVRPPSEFDIGSRWVSENTGYCPIGAWQLWHSSEDEWRGTRIKRYPERHGSACRSDIQHSLQWDRRHRHLLPEIICVHLESKALPLGANWRGRTSPEF